MGIQEEFNLYFPNLRIEFHKKPSKSGGAPTSEMVKSNSKTLAACRAVHNEGVITILPGMTIGDVKQNFSDVFGLSVEIFDKSGSVKDNKVLGLMPEF